MQRDIDDLPTEEEMRAVCVAHLCPVTMTDDISDLINIYQNIRLNEKTLDPEKYGSMIVMPAETTPYLD